MRYVIFYFILLYVVSSMLLGCSSPAKAMNFLTPDRVGYGISNGTMTGVGVGNKTMRNQEQPLELDFNGDSEATMVWLEWDFPQWEDRTKQKRDLRDQSKAIAKAIEKEAHLLYKDKMENMILDKWLEEKSNVQKKR